MIIHMTMGLAGLNMYSITQKQVSLIDQGNS